MEQELIFVLVFYKNNWENIFQWATKLIIGNKRIYIQLKHCSTNIIIEVDGKVVSYDFGIHWSSLNQSVVVELQQIRYDLDWTYGYHSFGEHENIFFNRKRNSEKYQVTIENISATLLDEIMSIYSKPRYYRFYYQITLSSRSFQYTSYSPSKNLFLGIFDSSASNALGGGFRSKSQSYIKIFISISRKQNMSSFHILGSFGAQPARRPTPPPPPPPTQDPETPSRCIWAIVSCCSRNDLAVRYACFEQLGCHGAFWDRNPCADKVQDAALEETSRFFDRK